jgi:hypothetical protein
MSRRKWLVRGLVFSLLGCLAAAGLLYLRYTDPAVVRRQVIRQLEARFPGAKVSVASAHLRLLGGIAVRDLRLARRDGTDPDDFTYIPSAIIYHDKERLLEGKRAVRKMELYKPRLHIIRRPDGTWNLDGLLGPAAPEELLPTFVIHEGTLIIEDRLRCPGAMPVEIKDVNATLVNDPVATVTFRAEGHCDLAGAIQTSGTWQRRSGEIVLSVQVPAVSVKTSLVQRLKAFLPEVTQQTEELEGIGQLRAEVGYHPGTAHPWSHDVFVHLTQGRLSHPQLPLTLTEVDASLRCREGQLTVEHLTARAGQAQIAFSDGKVQQHGTDNDFSGHLVVTHLPLSPELFTRLPATYHKLQERFAPVGPVKLDLVFGREAGQWRKHCIIEPEDLTAEFQGFHYPLQHITGKLDYDLDPGKQRDRLVVDLVGYAAARPVSVKGTVDGEWPKADMVLTVSGNDLPIDKTLLAALPNSHEEDVHAAPPKPRSPSVQDVARSFNPRGLVDFVATIRHNRGSEQCSSRYLVRFHDAAVQYEPFAYPIENVTGILDVLPDHYEFRDFHGTHKGAEVRVHGRSGLGPNRDRLEILISGDRVLLDSELEQNLSPALKTTWKTFSPTGRINFLTHVTCLPHQDPDLDVTVTACGCSIRPTFFLYDLQDVRGTVRYAQGWVSFGEFHGRHGATHLSVDEGQVYLKPAGGLWTKLTNIRGSPIVPDAAFLHALPEALGKACSDLGLHDPVTLKTQLIIDSGPDPTVQPVVWWDGEVGLQDATLQAGVELDHVTGHVACLGRYNGRQLDGVVGNILLDELTLFKQPFQAVHGQFEVPKDAPATLVIPGLQARLFDGNIGGPLRVDFGSTPRYEMNLTALGVRLEEFGRHNLGPNAEVSGPVAARLWLRGEGADLSRLQGEGSIHVPSGRMYNLPVLLDLLKVPGLRVPDHTAFEEAHAAFAIRGPRVLVNRLDLYGNAVSLSGKGEMNLDGSDINLDFYAVWGRIVQMLPPVLNKIPPAIGKQLLKIQMRGKVGDVRYTNEPVPVLVEPLKELLEKLAGRESGDKRRP